MNLLFWGAGAIGGTISGCLFRAGHDVKLVDREAVHVDAINTHGLTIIGPVETFTVRPPAFTPEATKGKYSVILLCVKAQDTQLATEQLLPHLRNDGYVLSVQNGLNELAIAEMIGRERTVGAFINFDADYMEPGVIRYGGRGAVVLGELGGEITPRLRKLHRVLLDFDSEAIITTNIWGYLWGKLAYGAMLFATALTNEPVADVLAATEYRCIFIALAQEVLSVAQAKGIKAEGFNGFNPSAFMPGADSDMASRSLDEIVSITSRSAQTHSGIWRDLTVRKRRTEVDAILGSVVASGAQVGIPTPLTACLVELIHDIEDGKRPQHLSTLDLLKGKITPRN